MKFWYRVNNEGVWCLLWTNPPNLPENVFPLTKVLEQYYDIRGFDMRSNPWRWILDPKGGFSDIIQYPGEDVTPEDFAKVLNLYEL